MKLSKGARRSGWAAVVVALIGGLSQVDWLRVAAFVERLLGQ